MISKAIRSFWITVCISLGYYMADAISNTPFDRSDVAVPMIAFWSSFCALVFFNDK